jgi:hypothetical protein
MFSSFRKSCQGGTANYTKPLAGLALALAAGAEGPAIFELLAAAHMRYRYNSGLQFAQKLHNCLFSLLGWAGEIHLSPSAQVPAQSRILKWV